MTALPGLTEDTRAYKAAAVAVRALFAPAEEGATAAAPEPLPRLPRLDALVRNFRLSSFEADLLLTLAILELDREAAAACAQRNGQSHAQLTVASALGLLAAPHWSALTPGATLLAYRMIEISSETALRWSRLRLDPRMLHHLLGVECLDERLQGLLECVAPPEFTSDSQRGAADKIVRTWTRGGLQPPVVVLAGCDAPSRRTTAAAAARAIGFELLAVGAEDVPAAAAERDTFVRLVERELVLGGAALFIDIGDQDDVGVAARVTAVADRFAGPLILGSARPPRPGRRTAPPVELAPTNAEEQRRFWRRALSNGTPANEEDFTRVVEHFEVSAEAACAIACGVDTEGPIADALWRACRHHLRAPLDDLTQRIEASATWNDLVLPEPTLTMLRTMAMHVRHRRRVLDDWGFGARTARGLGASAIFWGPSGTGKTYAAEALARDLDLDLHVVDVSQVVSKYIGETEKNLRRVFDAAERAGAILLFDEADALFGKRSEVKDSHDRYSNIEVSYLLQRMEAYRGLAILTTNMKDAIDSAFLRRVRFVVRFPFPDPEQRGEIWRRIVPSGTPTSGLDPMKLARLQIPGGTIRNIALNAAFLAAADGIPLGMSHMARAAVAEMAKHDKTLDDALLADWH
jgi:hypothetical protein